MFSNNLLPTNDQTRSYQFAKNRHQHVRGSDKDQRLKHIDEELSYWKQRLLAAPANNRQPIIDRLITLRAEQTTIFLANLHREKSALEDRKSKKIIAHYYQDCARLLKAAGSITS